MNSLLASVLLIAVAAAPLAAGEAALDTDEQKTLYALGHTLARSLTSFGLDEKEIEVVTAGVTDGALGRSPRVPLETYGPKIQALAQERIGKVAEIEKQAAKEFLDKAAKEKGAVRTESGLILTQLKSGSGKSPAETSTVKVHYHGTLRDGSVFDSSVDRKDPATFALNQVIPCWTEALQKMKSGGKARLVCPADLAYKDRGAPPLIKPGAALVFEVELLEIVKQ